MPGQAAGSRLGALGEIVDPDLPGRTAAGRAGKQPETADWGLGWDRLPAGSPPGPSRWGPVCLSRALSLWRAAERLVVPPSLSLKWSPWFTQHCGPPPPECLLVWQCGSPAPETGVHLGELSHRCAFPQRRPCLLRGKHMPRKSSQTPIVWKKKTLPSTCI
ncbi:hypothetical protein CapIbe_008114 [Capra ibex]